MTIVNNNGRVNNTRVPPSSGEIEFAQTNLKYMRTIYYGFTTTDHGKLRIVCIHVVVLLRCAIYVQQNISILIWTHKDARYGDLRIVDTLLALFTQYNPHTKKHFAIIFLKNINNFIQKKISSFVHMFLIYTNLIHCGRVTHICVSKQTIIASDNGLSPGQHQSIIWTNDGILLIQTSGTNLSEHPYISIQENAFRNVVFEMTAIKPRPQVC